ncbi:MAG: sialidase family protein [Anaerolineae bacterium]
MIQRYVVSRDDEVYEAWPDLARAQDGRLVCVFSECTHHLDRSFTRLVTVESLDDGRSWSQKRPLTEATRGLPYWDCARITALRDGRLAVVADLIHGDERGDSSLLEVFLWLSSDHGMTWDGPQPVPVRGIVPDRLLELPSGRWLCAAHVVDPKTGYLMQRVWLSDDQGDTWHGPFAVAQQVGLHLCEASLVPLEDGTVVALMRENSGLGRDCYKAISRDWGEHWDGPYRFPLPGCHRPVGGMLQEGLVLITYRFHHGGRSVWGGGTQNMMAALTNAPSLLSTERQQATTRILPLDYDHSAQPDLGYTGWVQLPDGSIYVVNYIMDDAPKGQIRGYRLDLTEWGDVSHLLRISDA